MQILLFKEAQFQKSLAALRLSGGVASRAADEVDRILGRLTNGTAPAEAFGNVTKHGETRIPHGVKYDLGGGYRLVCVQDAGVIQILFVGKHDDCDRWIERHRGHRLVADVATKRLTAVHEVRFEDPLPPHLHRRIFDPEVPLVAKVDEAHLDLLNVRPSDYRRVSAITAASADDEIQDALLQVADARVRDTLLGVLLELREDRIEAAHALIRRHAGAARPVDESPGLLEEALASGANSDTVVNLRDLSEEELTHLLGRTQFQDWLLYLHPDQRPVVAAGFPGPTLLRGVSGSGKTCVVVHRAKHLATRYASSRVVILTLNPALAALIDDLVAALCPVPVRERIDVVAVPDLCRRIVAHYDPLRPVLDFDPRSNETLEDNWTETFNKPEQLERLRPIITSLANTYEIDAERYIRDEFIWVRSAFTRRHRADEGSVLSGREIYKDPERSPRRGREVPFIRDWRERILAALEFYEEWSQGGGFYDHAGLALLAHGFIGDLRRRRPPQLEYRAVLVDEYQDLGRVELEIISALAPPQEDGLFLAGDPRQQVFPKDHDLPGAGIVVRQKKFFKKNYRNTRQILEAGVALIKNFGPGHVGDDVEVLDPEFSPLQRAKPLVVSAKNLDSEIAFIVDFIKGKRRIDNHPVCIVACGLREDDEAGLGRLLGRFADEGMDIDLLQRDARVRAGSVFLSALETVKGFEFSLVVVCQCGEGQMPVPSLPVDEAWRDASRLYVAFTRARDELVVTHTGTPSRFLKGIEAFLNWSNVMDQGLGGLGVDRVEDAPAEARVAEHDAVPTELSVPALPSAPAPSGGAMNPGSFSGDAADQRRLLSDGAELLRGAEGPTAAIPESRNDEILDELKRLKAENDRLRSVGPTSMRVGEKGGVSLYGLGRFPVTLYKEQWLTVLEFGPDIRRFIVDNRDRLKRR